MVSLWGSKSSNPKDEDGDDTQDDGAGERGGESSRNTSSHRQEHRQPDERSRLLPRNEGYLSPDDPAVCLSQMNQLAGRLTDHTGLSLQPLERSCPQILLRSLLGPHIPLVDSPSRIDLRQSAIYEYSRLRLL